MMRKAVTILLWLAAWQVLLPAILCAGTDLSASVTSGKDHYLANYTSLSLGLMDRLNLDLSCNYSDSGPADDYTVQDDSGVVNEDINRDPKPVRTYTGGLNAELTDNLSVRGNYSVTPEVEGFEARGFGAGLTVTFTGFPVTEEEVPSDYFHTSLDFDYASSENKYDVHTPSFTALYKTKRGRKLLIYIPAKDSVEKIKQVSYTIGLTETIYQNTSLYLAYANYTYDPNIEENILLVKARQTNAMLFTLSPGLSGFPKYTYEIRATQVFFSLINMSVDYLHLVALQFSLNENGTPYNNIINNLADDFYESKGVKADSYTLGLDYYLTGRITINASYNLYKEAYLDRRVYYTLGASISF
ncbi:MAG: hypothetical protein HY920_04770 [Elusimicrobia bacterium]|nr:hypothetical protein [Elusimicrobiota bacterium]